jgi:hypothetical protein
MEEIRPFRSHWIRQIIMHNYAHKGLLSTEDGERSLGVVLTDGRFICVWCEEFTRLFEDYFDAFDYILYETNFIKTLVNWIYAHMDVIPAKLRRGAYLPKAQCEQALKGAGIDLTNARAEVHEAWRQRWS